MVGWRLFFEPLCLLLHTLFYLENGRRLILILNDKLGARIRSKFKQVMAKSFHLRSLVHREEYHSPLWVLLEACQDHLPVSSSFRQGRHQDLTCHSLPGEPCHLPSALSAHRDHRGPFQTIFNVCKATKMVGGKRKWGKKRGTVRTIVKLFPHHHQLLGTTGTHWHQLGVIHTPGI